MPAKMACQKAVLISVYEEKPTKKRISSNSNHHHHYYVHHSIKIGDTSACKGYNRRAQLLLYSRRLRESARPDPKTLPSVASVQEKPKHNNTTTCPGKWEILLNLNFCRSLTSVQIKKGKKEKEHTGSAMPVMKSLEVRKKRGFVSKFLSMLQKHR